ncbi:MAG: hypothetical protein GY842_19220 [bacterium]|nr:hypothetical protein [bacterium]
MFTAAVTLGCILLGSGAPELAPAQSPAQVEQSAEQERTTSTEEEWVSDLLPESLADYVRAHGLDRPAEDLSAHALKGFESQSPSRYATLELLFPEVLQIVSERMTLQYVDPHTRVVAATCVTVIVDEEVLDIPLGEEVPLGAELVAGAVLNLGPGTVQWEAPDGDVLLSLPDHMVDNLSTPRCSKSCSIKCASNERACCYTDDKGCAKCTCVARGTSCPDGTTGGTECSVSTDADSTPG